MRLAQQVKERRKTAPTKEENSAETKPSGLHGSGGLMSTKRLSGWLGVIMQTGVPTRQASKVVVDHRASPATLRVIRACLHAKLTVDLARTCKSRVRDAASVVCLHYVPAQALEILDERHISGLQRIAGRQDTTHGW